MAKRRNTHPSAAPQPNHHLVGKALAGFCFLLHTRYAYGSVYSEFAGCSGFWQCCDHLMGLEDRTCIGTVVLAVSGVAALVTGLILLSQVARDLFRDNRLL